MLYGGVRGEILFKKILQFLFSIFLFLKELNIFSFWIYINYLDKFVNFFFRFSILAQTLTQKIISIYCIKKLLDIILIKFRAIFNFI